VRDGTRPDASGLVSFVYVFFKLMYIQWIEVFASMHKITPQEPDTSADGLCITFLSYVFTINDCYCYTFQTNFINSRAPGSFQMELMKEESERNRIRTLKAHHFA